VKLKLKINCSCSSRIQAAFGGVAFPGLIGVGKLVDAVRVESIINDSVSDPPNLGHLSPRREEHPDPATVGAGAGPDGTGCGARITVRRTAANPTIPGCRHQRVRSGVGLPTRCQVSARRGAVTARWQSGTACHAPRRQRADGTGSGPNTLTKPVRPPHAPPRHPVRARFWSITPFGIGSMATAASRANIGTRTKTARRIQHSGAGAAGETSKPLTWVASSGVSSV